MGFGVGSLFGKNKSEEDTETEQKKAPECESYIDENTGETVVILRNETLDCLTPEKIAALERIYASGSTSATKKEDEALEIKNVNFFNYFFGRKDDDDFTSLTSENSKYIYYQSFSPVLPENIDSDEFTKGIFIRCGMDRDEVEKIMSDPYKINHCFFMKPNGEFEFFIPLFKYDEDGESYLYKRIDFVLTENERNMIIEKARQGFMKVYGADLLKLPELIKQCSTIEQLYDRFEIESGKGTEGIIEEYGFKNMRAHEFDSDFYKKYKIVLECFFTPNFEVSMKIRNKANMKNFGIVHCWVWFNNKMNMTLAVKDGNEKWLKIKLDHTLEAEIRAGISAMYEKYKGYSLAEYMQKNCPEVLSEKLSPDDIKYYCYEIKRQQFFYENMGSLFFEEKRFDDWVQAWSSEEIETFYPIGYRRKLTPQMFHQEFDYYKSPNTETRNVFLSALKDYERRRFEETGELPF
ncbi:MAG: hypothetical protein NC177_09675 [Ruminococcus flavefaciens]|nr:hypothetical protein [Ruminococcus flavefaciens]